jgi:predicted transcriptional regulator
VTRDPGCSGNTVLRSSRAVLKVLLCIRFKYLKSISIMYMENDKTVTDTEKILAKLDEIKAVLGQNLADLDGAQQVHGKVKNKSIMSRSRVEQIWMALDPEKPATPAEVAEKTNTSENMVRRALYVLLAEGRTKRDRYQGNAWKYTRAGQPCLEPQEAMRRFRMEKLRDAIPSGQENALPVSEIAKSAGVNPVTARVKLQMLQAAGEIEVVQVRSEHNQPVWAFYRH